MTALTTLTPTLKAGKIARGWHLVDMRDKVLGRTATDIAQLLMGKHKSTYTPHMDNGDFVVVINANDIQVTGKKLTDKVYTRYSGYPGGLKKTDLGKLMQKDSRKVIQNAVSGMLPKNKLRKVRMTRLFVFTDDNHPYTGKF